MSWRAGRAGALGELGELGESLLDGYVLSRLVCNQSSVYINISLDSCEKPIHYSVREKSRERLSDQVRVRDHRRFREYSARSQDSSS